MTVLPCPNALSDVYRAQAGRSQPPDYQAKPLPHPQPSLFPTDKAENLQLLSKTQFPYGQPEEMLVLTTNQAVSERNHAKHGHVSAKINRTVEGILEGSFSCDDKNQQWYYMWRQTALGFNSFPTFTICAPSKPHFLVWELGSIIAPIIGLEGEGWWICLLLFLSYEIF